MMSGLSNYSVASAILKKATDRGFTCVVKGTILTLSKNIPINDPSAFAQAESDSSAILSMIPRTSPGSIWGTDGGSVGGMVAMTTGNFVMNKSGCSKRILNIIKMVR